MKELAQYLLENLYVDFQGGISLDTVRDFLREDDGPEARRLLAKIIEEDGVNELLVTLADCLAESLSTGIRVENVQDALNMYADS